MELLGYNMDDGFPDAIIKGLRASFLSEDQYSALRNSTNMADFKMALEETDYAAYVVNEANPMEVSTLRTKLKQKLKDELDYVHNQAVSPLTDFIQRILHSYQIDNIVNIIEGLKNNIDLATLLKHADPLGYFDELKTIRTSDTDDYTSLYETVLIDLPVGQYFLRFLDKLMVANNQRDSSMIPTILKDYTPERIKNLLKKIWIKDLHQFCTLEWNMNGTTRAVMDDLLKFESDCMTIQILYNSIGNNEFSNSTGRTGVRKSYMNNLGYLYPGRDKEINQVEDFPSLKQAVGVYNEYEAMLMNVQDPSKEEAGEFSSTQKSLDDVMFDFKTRRFSIAFEGQFHYGGIYAYLRLKEQEIRNIVWLAELVSLGVPKSSPGWRKYFVPFTYMNAE